MNLLFLDIEILQDSKQPTTQSKSSDFKIKLGLHLFISQVFNPLLILATNFNLFSPGHFKCSSHLKFLD